MRMTDLKVGWAIVGNDGHPLGSVHAVGQNYVLATRGILAPPLYVPASAIANVERGVVHLNLAKHEAEQMGWEEKPRESDAPDDAGDSDLLHRHI
jgi:hypothetical protein